VKPDRWSEILADVTKIAGVRGAVVVSSDDGLVVHEAAMDGIATGDIAALATAVTRCAERLFATLEDGTVRLCTMAATSGTVVAVQGAEGLWLVAVTAPDAELGRLRLMLGDVAPELS
jgi:predicted regulator of Ras-like GTPase activity (Roadblock/LC7/MglB family)